MSVMMRGYQQNIEVWMQDCFIGDLKPLISNVKERNYRFIEEAVELVQANGCTKEDVLAWVDYVYNRPVGVPAQEVGGVMVTLAALCSASKIDMQVAALAEYWRVNRTEVMEKIRAKQVTKQVICGSKEKPA
jgi:hypothetical protein